MLNLDPQIGGLICLEEPENGIHPQRIPAILQLLQDIACDVESPVGADNPLRQIIINTHSPAVVSQVPDDSLLVATTKEVVNNGSRFNAAQFGWLPDTWRSENEPDVGSVAKGELLSYLNPALPVLNDVDGNGHTKKVRRVIDRKDLKQLVLFPPETFNH
ncbi:MAG: AAA family ATPase [Caldilineaceae bacterium]